MCFISDIFGMYSTKYINSVCIIIISYICYKVEIHTQHVANIYTFFGEFNMLYGFTEHHPLLSFASLSYSIQFHLMDHELRWISEMEVYALSSQFVLLARCAVHYCSDQISQFIRKLFTPSTSHNSFLSTILSV